MERILDFIIWYLRYNMTKINNFIFNSDFTTEKLVPTEFVISNTHPGGSLNGRLLLGTYNVTVPSGLYIINSSHTSNRYPYSGSGQFVLYATGLADYQDPPYYFYYNVYGEIIQTSNTTISLRLWLNIDGGGSATIPSISFNVKIKLTYLPI